MLARFSAGALAISPYALGHHRGHTPWRASTTSPRRSSARSNRKLPRAHEHRAGGGLPRRPGCHSGRPMFAGRGAPTPPPKWMLQNPPHRCMRGKGRVHRPWALHDAASAAHPARRHATGLRAHARLVAVGVGLAPLRPVRQRPGVDPAYRAARPVSALQRSDANTPQIDDLYLDQLWPRPRSCRPGISSATSRAENPPSSCPSWWRQHPRREHRAYASSARIVPPRRARRRGYPSLTSPIVLSDRHNAYMVLFPARDNRGHRFLDMRAGTVAVEATTSAPRRCGDSNGVCRSSTTSTAQRRSTG